jgi:ubiquinone/menaquinone biosynthesis C-methylase UbiE
MVNSFDERAATWDDNPRRIKLVEQVSELLLKKIDFKKTDLLIDYGCGTGLLGYKFANSVKEVLFCDTSEKMLEQVQLKKAYYGSTNVRTLQSDFTLQPLPDEKVNLIFSMLVLHHVKEIEALANNFASLLEPDGLFCWIDLDQEDGSFHVYDESIPHLGFSREKIEEVLAPNFEIVFYTNELRIMKENEGNFREYPLFVVIGKKQR